MSDFATQIWKAMRADQYLLYIGEQPGGCTADDEFFELVEDHEVDTPLTEGMGRSFVSFWAMHDFPHLFKK